MLGGTVGKSDFTQKAFMPLCSVKRNNTKRDSSFTWASPEVMLFGLFQLFKGGDFAPVDYLSLSNKR